MLGSATLSNFQFGSELYTIRRWRTVSFQAYVKIFTAYRHFTVFFQLQLVLLFGLVPDVNGYFKFQLFM